MSKMDVTETNLTDAIESFAATANRIADERNELLAENKRLLNALHSALDHACIARLLCSGKARWEPATNEFCIAGLRYSTGLDEFGVPIIHLALRSVIVKAEGR